MLKYLHILEMICEKVRILSIVNKKLVLKENSNFTDFQRNNCIFMYLTRKKKKKKKKTSAFKESAMRKLRISETKHEKVQVTQSLISEI